tara:strand:- start:346 stop:636 length:291 start_codon:yes stop_codon:yes gene_type:complete
MKLLKKTEKIDSIESNNLALLKEIKKLQKENAELRLNILDISKNLTLMSSTLAEKAVVQSFLVEQVAKTTEMVVEIDKILNPSAYIKFDLMNEPYN